MIYRNLRAWSLVYTCAIAGKAKGNSNKKFNFPHLHLPFPIFQIQNNERMKFAYTYLVTKNSVILMAPKIGFKMTIVSKQDHQIWVVVVLRSPIHANEPSEYNGMLYRTSNRVLNNGIKVIILICMDGTSQYHHHPNLTGLCFPSWVRNRHLGLPETRHSIPSRMVELSISFIKRVLV